MGHTYSNSLGYLPLRPAQKNFIEGTEGALGFLRRGIFSPVAELRNVFVFIFGYVLRE